jgi:hypothetical protein
LLAAVWLGVMPAAGQDGGAPPPAAGGVMGPFLPRAVPATESRGLGAAKPGGEGTKAAKAPVLSTALPLAGVLSLILGAGAVVRFLAKRAGLKGALGAGGRGPAGILEVIGRYPIARGSTLVLLKVDRRMLLLSQTATGRLGLGATFSTLCEISDPEEVGSILLKAQEAQGDSMARRFQGLLSRQEEMMEPRRGAKGGADVAEVWDDRSAIPVVDVTGREEPAGVSSLRKRLAGFASGGGA